MFQVTVKESNDNTAIQRKFICIKVYLLRIIAQLLDHSSAFLFASITGISNSSAILDTVIFPSRNAFFTRLLNLQFSIFLSSPIGSGSLYWSTFSSTFLFNCSCSFSLMIPSLKSLLIMHFAETLKYFLRLITSSRPIFSIKLLAINSFKDLDGTSGVVLD